MANILNKRIAQEGPRNAIVRLTGVLDTTDVYLTPAIALQDFTNNDVQAGSLVGFRVDFIEWAIGDGIEILLEWNSATPQQIYPIAGRGKVKAYHFGGMQPDQTLPGFNGNINLKTTGMGTVTQQQGGIQNYSILIEMTKLYR